MIRIPQVRRVMDECERDPETHGRSRLTSVRSLEPEFVVKQGHRVEGRAADLGAPMEMGPRHSSGVAGQPDELPDIHRVPWLNKDLGEMGVQCKEAATMIQDNGVAGIVKVLGE